MSELIREAEAGGDVIIARNGEPVAKLIPWPPSRPTRVPGAWAGRVSFVADPVDTDDEVTQLFEESAAADLP